ncbi:hypothetical protein [Nitratireductor pacificus]|uniref:Uncharacterized protein n=1 Tax=Nitratireductor pacificus pht-3B TaxID=391937 RepID=K2MYQ8_9HYPH|nr:hypothetical protein [Nitratireductor pacificus]EKF17098.1 hypothetical protein NA2_20048 [Nitratireductor pacificus pht-3B]
MSHVNCNACGAPMAVSDFRACEACRTEWREAKRKPGGPAEQRQRLEELVAAANDVTRMLEAVRYTCGLGQGQIDRLQNAKSAIIRAEGALKQ